MRIEQKAAKIVVKVGDLREVDTVSLLFQVNASRDFRRCLEGIVLLIDIIDGIGK
jgi:hypothetical protein